MKHFIGGCCMGLMVALIGLKQKPAGGDGWAYVVAHLFTALAFGGMAWGLLP